jgi:hypothetical protein
MISRQGVRDMNRRTVFATLFSLLVAAPAFAQPSPTTPTPATPPAPPEDVQPPQPPPGATQPEPMQPVAQPDEPHTNPNRVETPTQMPAPVPTGTTAPVVSAKWDASLYGFVEADSIYDSTQGFLESAGNGAVSRPNTYAGDHPQMTYGARNSRIGLRLAAPDYDGIKTSAQLEMDFLGNQAGKPFDSTGLVSEGATFNNPTFRIRHMNLKMETDYVDVLIGQYWELFGWQSYFHPNTVEIQGVPGQVYSRTPQIRLSKTIKTDAVNVDVAVAALRSPQRASAVPDGQAGVKLSFNQLKAWHTAGSTGTGLDAAAIGVSGVFRHFDVDQFAATPHSEVSANGHGIAIDALVPIIPATKRHHENALTLTGEFATGTGIADLYTGLSGGVANPSLPVTTPGGPAPTYTTNIDPGLAMYTFDATTNTATLHTVDFQSYIIGLQYYLPPTGRAWIALNYSHISSDNDGATAATTLGTPAKVWTKENWADANLFVDVTPAVRLGLEGALFDMTYADAKEAKNYRVQFSGFFIF